MHRLLAKQLAKSADTAGAVDVEQLCQLVSDAYDEFDRDRRRTDRSIELMIQEIDAVNRGLENAVTERTRELREREVDLRAQNLRFNAAISNMSQGLAMFDADARLVICNQRYRNMYGLRPDDVRPGMTLRELIGLRIAQGTFLKVDPDRYVSNELESLQSGRSTSNYAELSDGRTIVTVSQPIAGGGWVVTHEDVTERRRAELTIAHMARHDALTDLPNRLLLQERLGEAVAHLKEGQRLAVFCLDLDKFKNVNDTMGHPAGDELLRTVAARLQGCLRETDFVSRVGGDEFLIVQTGITDAAEAEHMASRVVESIGAPYDLNGHMINVNTSIGIALAPEDGLDIDTLLRNADLALYGAKADGQGVYRFFEPGMDACMKARHALEVALRRALEKGEFELHYQPIIDLVNDEVKCCEALIRWRHPERGIVSPNEFIPMAEEIGLISAIGEWAIRRACDDAAKWPEHIGVAVNLSPTQLTGKNLVSTVLNALAASRLAAGRLELEITEAVLMQNTEIVLQTLHQLRSLGVRVSMDDFGTGYSSLGYLLKFPFNKIKIDRCFVSGLGSGSESSAIIQAVAGLARSLRMTTTAEGVETRAQLDLVRSLGCTEVQGYFFSPPVTGERLRELIARKAGNAAEAATPDCAADTASVSAGQSRRVSRK